MKLKRAAAAAGRGSCLVRYDVMHGRRRGAMREKREGEKVNGVRWVAIAIGNCVSSGAVFMKGTSLLNDRFKALCADTSRLDLHCPVGRPISVGRSVDRSVGQSPCVRYTCRYKTQYTLYVRNDNMGHSVCSWHSVSESTFSKISRVSACSLSLSLSLSLSVLYDLIAIFCDINRYFNSLYNNQTYHK